MNKIKNAYANLKKGIEYVIRKRRKIEAFIGKLVVYALLITVSYVFLFPLIRMISLAFMSSADIIDPEVDYLPKEPTLDNFRAAWIVMKAFSAFWASFWTSSTLAIAQVIVSALTGYAFARYEFRFKRFWFVMILVAFIIPVPVMLIPRLMMFSTLQVEMRSWAFTSDTFKLFGTIYPQASMAILGQGVNSTILILIFYNFFRMVPRVLYEAAKIDGASALQQFWHITIKMSLTTIIVVFLFSFVWNWNETYVTGLLNGSLENLPNKLASFETNLRTAPADSSAAQDGVNRVTEAHRMAATLMTMIPLFVIYLVAQRQFVEGIENTGITGE